MHVWLLAWLEPVVNWLATPDYLATPTFSQAKILCFLLLSLSMIVPLLTAASIQDNGTSVTVIAYRLCHHSEESLNETLNGTKL